ncbi:MAG: hypothetical protein HYT42_00360 [Candidatus Sungbacteria bacterium]|nr:hypothetical protein [Candidatus Sungbacteria bacterium]
MNKAAINKNRLFFWAVIISVLNPIFSGLILGLVLLSEPDFKKEGRVVTLFSLVWGAIVLALLVKFKDSLSL